MNLFRQDRWSLLVAAMTCLAFASSCTTISVQEPLLGHQHPWHGDVRFNFTKQYVDELQKRPIDDKSAAVSLTLDGTGPETEWSAEWLLCGLRIFPGSIYDMQLQIVDGRRSDAVLGSVSIPINPTTEPYVDVVCALHVIPSKIPTQFARGEAIVSTVNPTGVTPLAFLNIDRSALIGTVDQFPRRWYSLGDVSLNIEPNKPRCVYAWSWNGDWSQDVARLEHHGRHAASESEQQSALERLEVPEWPGPVIRVKISTDPRW
jgi:hypothetical protein